MPALSVMANESVYFFGRFASAPKRDLEKFARELGYRVSSSLRDTLDLIVLGEDEPVSIARRRLGAEFDARSREAFESGALAIISESSFLARHKSSRERASELCGSTPAAVAELVGTTVVVIRRWLQRGFLRPFYRGDRLPLLASRETVVARRLVFLTSTGLSDEFLARRFVSFANLDLLRRRVASPSVAPEFLFDYNASDLEKAPSSERETTPYPESLSTSLATAPFDVGALILKSTLSSDGKDILFFNDGVDLPPVDSRGQRRFEFAATPADGAYDAPNSAPLSAEESQIALADRLRDWNAAQTTATNQPAFLTLFSDVDGTPGAGDALTSLADLMNADAPSAVARALNAEPPAGSTHSFLVAKDARERIRAAAGRKLVDLCEDAWNLEREGYWEEAARVYRAAALAGGADPSVCYRLGKVLFLLGDYSAARERFFMALELDEEFVDARIELGKTFVALGELEDAVSCFQGALADRPADASLFYELGKLYFQLGRRDESHSALRSALANAKDAKLIEEIKKTSLEITLGVL